MSIADEVLAAVASAASGVKVYDVRAPRNADGSPVDLRYVVVFPDLGVLSAPTIGSAVDEALLTFRLMYVATTRPEVQALADVVRTALVGVAFADSAWSAQFDTDFHNTTPVSWDATIPSRVVMYATDEFQAQASKA